LDSKQIFKVQKKILQIEIIFAGAFIAIVFEDQILVRALDDFFKE